MATPPAERLSRLIAELGDALAEERQALIGGNVGRITAAVERKTLLAEQIEQATGTPGILQPSREQLAPLARYNQENAIICDAMLRHLTEAIDRLRQVDLHRSYTADGSEEPRSASHALGAA